MAESETWLVGEPGLSEMLADPIVRLVMRRDGIGAEHVRKAIARARMALLAGASGPARRHRAADAPHRTAVPERCAG